MVFLCCNNWFVDQITQIRASGGGTKGALWRQILADVLESDLVAVNTTEGAAFGAALLAGVGAGAWDDVVSACHATIRIIGQTKPNTANFAAYRQAHSLYREMYPLLNECFKRMLN